ncbi:MAG TPA: UDP-N-acetylmuramoyl-L-alanine--D-glutamate ligase [Burkholderiales bacterium]
MREPAFSRLSTPVPFPLKGKRVLVLGLGDTGLSVARWVEREGGTPRVADTRSAPPRRQNFAGEFHAGSFDASLLRGIDLLCISPGLSLEEPVVREAMQKRIAVVGDVELFAWGNRKPVLAITGTNGKSTVTALTGHLLRVAGVDCEVAGNISPPVLEASLRRSHPPAAWVLELSSYQLETTWSLAPHAAAMLNLSEDHFDRYAGLADYGAAKARVFQGAGVQVLNRDDARSLAMALPGRKVVTFGAGGDFEFSGGSLKYGKHKILDAGELQIHGAHNVANALAACALAFSIETPLSKLKEGLRTFRGLPHRLELVARRRGVDWYDDSKGTNVGATVAALTGLKRPTVLILGGEGKGQDFSPLRHPIRQFALKTLLIGRDAPLIEKALSGLPTERCASLEEAVRKAAEIQTEAVLLSPACASFDMFRDYRHRGEVFAAAVRGLGA